MVAAREQSQTSPTFKPTISSSLHTEVAMNLQPLCSLLWLYQCERGAGVTTAHLCGVLMSSSSFFLLKSNILEDERILERFLHTGQELNDNPKPLSPTLMALLYRGPLFYFW